MLPVSRIRHQTASRAVLAPQIYKLTRTSPTVMFLLAKDMEDARRSAQKAIAAMQFRSEVKLVTCAQLSEAGS